MTEHKIQMALARALEHDQQARGLRIEAGRLLAQLRANTGREDWWRGVVRDEVTAETLIDMAAHAEQIGKGERPAMSRISEPKKAV